MPVIYCFVKEKGPCYSKVLTEHHTQTSKSCEGTSWRFAVDKCHCFDCLDYCFIVS